MSEPSMQVTAVVLAAGRSRRMRAANKLLLPVGGVPMVVRVVDTVLEAAPSEVVVVTGHEAERVRAALAGRPVRSSHNPDFALGMATSIRAGVAAADERAAGFLICLGDMPAVASGTLRQLLRVHAEGPPGSIVTVELDGRRGNPVLFDARYRAELLALEGDVGARALLDRHADHVVALPVDDAGVLVDLDTPEAYRKWIGERGEGR